MNNYYCGIGSRDTPQHILNIMHHIAAYLGTQGWTLRSGGAPGADSAFEKGASDVNAAMEIYLPWENFNHSKSELHPKKYPFSMEERTYAAQHHPAWNKCSPSARLMHQRNVRQIIGLEPLHGEIVMPSKFVVCWTRDGLLNGGTAQALRIANSLAIPVINLGHATSASRLEGLVKEIDVLNNKLKDRTVLGNV